MTHAPIERRDQAASPRVCILTDYELSHTHGTGSLLLRTFANYPPSALLNVSCERHAPVGFCEHVLWDRRFGSQAAMRRSLMHGNLGSLARQVQGRSAGRAVVRAVERFRPDVLLVIVCAHQGFQMAAEIITRLPRTPVYSSFWDLQLEWAPDKREQDRCLDLILRSSSHVDCISEGIADHVAPRLGHRPPVANFFCCDLPRVWKTEHRSVSEGLQPVIVGSLWMRDAINPLLWLLWRAQNEFPTLRDAVWYAHPESLGRLKLSPATLPIGITYGGHYTGEALLDKLRATDFCIVPFNAHDEPEGGYARYSVPSRMSELCALGMPTLALAGAGTSYAAYLWRTRCAECVSPADPRQAYATFKGFLENRERRRDLGATARTLAESEFESGRHQAVFYDRLRRIAAGQIVPEAT